MADAKGLKLVTSRFGELVSRNASQSLNRQLARSPIEPDRPWAPVYGRLKERQFLQALALQADAVPIEEL